MLKCLVPLAALCLSAVPANADSMRQAVLHEMNFARTDPAAYADVVRSHADASDRDVRETITFLKRARPMPALRFSPAMSAGADTHVRSQGPAGNRGHRGTGQSQPWDRLEQFGEWEQCVGENIYYGSRDARGIVIALLVDKGVPDRAHRRNIFDRKFTVAGIAHGAHRRFGAMCVINFAGAFTAKSDLAVMRQIARAAQ